MKKAFLIALMLCAAGPLSAAQLRGALPASPGEPAGNQGFLLVEEDAPYRSIFSTQLDNGPILNNAGQTLFA